VTRSRTGENFAGNLNEEYRRKYFFETELGDPVAKGFFNWGKRNAAT